MTTLNREELERRLATVKRVLEIRAAQRGISLEQAESQAREDVAFSRGEEYKPTLLEYLDWPRERQDRYREAHPELAQLSEGAFAPESERPETTEERGHRMAQGDLTDKEAAEWQAKIERDYVDKALRKVVASARAEQSADVKRATDAGADPAQARWRYSNLDSYLPPLANGETQVERQARIKALESADQLAIEDSYKVGSHDEGEAE